MFPTTDQIIELARGKPIVLPTHTADGERIGKWKLCHCGSSHRTPVCPTCHPRIRPAPGRNLAQNTPA